MTISSFDISCIGIPGFNAFILYKNFAQFLKLAIQKDFLRVKHKNHIKGEFVKIRKFILVIDS